MNDNVNMMRKTVLDYLLQQDNSRSATLEAIVYHSNEVQLNDAMNLIDCASSNGLIINVLSK